MEIIDIRELQHSHVKRLVDFVHVNVKQVRKLGSRVIISVATRKLELVVDNHLHRDLRLCSITMNKVALREKKIHVKRVHLSKNVNSLLVSLKYFDYFSILVKQLLLAANMEQ